MSRNVDANPNRLVNLEIFEKSNEAMVLVSKIEAAGLFVRSYNAWPMPFVPRALGGIQVKVRAVDYEIAKAIMEDAEAEPGRALTPWQRERPTLLVFATTIVLLAWQILVGIGELSTERQVGFNGLVIAVALVWFFALLEAIRTKRRWWLLASAPIAIAQVARIFLQS